MHDVAGYLKNHIFNELNLSFKSVIFAERLKCCGMEDRTVVAHGCQKTKKIICGMEGENGVAYGLLPSPTRCSLDTFLDINVRLN